MTFSRSFLQFDDTPNKGVTATDPAVMVQDAAIDTKVFGPTRTKMMLRSVLLDPILRRLGLLEQSVSNLNPTANTSGWITEIDALEVLGGNLAFEPDTTDTGFMALELVDTARSLNVANIPASILNAAVQNAANLNTHLRTITPGASTPQQLTRADELANLLRRSLEEIANYRPPRIANGTFHDFGLNTPTILPNDPAQVFAHLEGGAGYLVDGNTLSDEWSAAIVNTTDSPQPLIFENTTAFVRNGAAVATATSPYQVAKDTVCQLQHTLNNGQSYLQIIPAVSAQPENTGIPQNFRFKFTSDTSITALSGDRIFIHAPGDISIESGLVSGDWFLVVDPYQKLKSQSNTVIAPTGQLIADGQLKSGIQATDRFDLNSVGASFSGGEIRFILDGSGQNWAIDLSSCLGSGSTPVEPVTIQWVDVDPDFVSTVDDAVFVELRIF